MAITSLPVMPGRIRKPLVKIEEYDFWTGRRYPDLVMRA
jgi:hypothetical protein